MCVYPLEIFGISHTYLGFCTSFTRKIFSAAPPEEEGPRNQNGPRHQSPNVSSARLKFGDHLDDSWMMAGFCWSDDRWMIFKVSNGSPFLMFFLMIKTTRVQSAVFWCFNGSNLWPWFPGPHPTCWNRLNFTNHGFVMGVLWSFNAFHGFSSGFSTVSIAVFGSKFQHQDHGGEIRSPQLSHTMAPWWSHCRKARDESRLQLCAMWHCRTLGLIPCDTNWPGSQKMLVNALSIQDSRNKTNLRTSMFSRNSCWSTGC